MRRINLKNTREAELTSGTISVWRKLGYGMGEMGSQFSWAMVSSYLTLYYTNVVGLAPAVISAIMMAARIWDAVNDPMFGAIAESTRSRWGRFRPYILFGSPFLALFSCLMFLNLPLDRIWQGIWCIATYFLCDLAYTVVNISVGCLANSMTVVNSQRVSLNAFKGVMGSFTSLLVGALTMPLLLYFGEQSVSSDRGYFIVALIYSCMSMPCFLLCFFSSRETVQVKRQVRGNTTLALIRSFRYTFEDRNARMLIGAEITFLTGIFGRLGIMTYYFIYVLNSALLTAGFATAMSLGMMGGNVAAAFLMNHFDKKWVGAGSAICQAVCCAGFFLLGETQMKFLVIPLGFIYGLTNLSANVSYGLSAEIIDDNWLRTGIRSDGVIYSCISFATKLGNAIGGSIGILALGAVGFVAGQELPDHVLSRMNAVINLGPMLFFLLSAAFFAGNHMTNAKAAENEKKLKELQENMSPVVHTI